MSIHDTRRFEHLKLFVDGYFKNMEYVLTPMTGDAGYRSYFRVKMEDASYVVMDCPTDYTSVQPFINIANFLNEQDFSAPEIIESDIKNGFLILQDFGDVTIKNHLLKLKTQIEKLSIYQLSIDLLIRFQKLSPSFEIKEFSNDLLCLELDLFLNHYIPYKNQKTVSVEDKKEFLYIWQTMLAKQKLQSQNIVFRDYHVENLMYLEQEKDIKKLGLLDFQDALLGSPVYDLVSILEDARIDVPRALAMELVEYYAQAKGLDLDQVLTDYHILGAQRNLRILGVFTRKYFVDKKDTYLQYIPRVLEYLNHDLSHPALKQLKSWLLKIQVI